MTVHNSHLRLVSAWLCSLALVTAGTATTSLAAAANSDRGLLYGETARLDALDPYTAHEAAGQRIGDLIFDSLVEIGPGGRYLPSLAKEWEIENGGTSVVFTLREGVTWHGKGAKKFSADDVVATVRVLTNPQSEIPNRERFQAITGAEVLAPTRVRISLALAHADPLKALMFKILPSHALEGSTSLKRGSAFARHPIGTGPYALGQTNEQGEILFVANKQYFRGKPAIEQLVMKPFADQSVMAQSLMFQSLDLVTYVSPNDLSEIMGDRKLGVVPYDALSFSFLAMNTSRGILKDKRVRQAIGQAVNRKEMLEAFFQSKGQLITGPFPPTSWAYNLDVKPQPFDPEVAKSILDSAGFKKDASGAILDRTGKPAKLVFAVPVAGESEMIKKIVLAMQGYLSQIGIATDLQFMDWLVWKKRVMRDHDYDLTIASWSFDDASNITSLFHSSSAEKWGNNFVLYRNTHVDSMLTEANSTNDFEKKRAIYQKLHAVLAEEAPYTYLWTLTHHAAHTQRIKGVKVEPYAFFRHIRQWKAASGEDSRGSTR